MQFKRSSIYFILSIFLLHPVKNQNYQMSPKQFLERNNEIFPNTIFFGPNQGVYRIDCDNESEWNGSRLKLLRFKNYKINPFYPEKEQKVLPEGTSYQVLTDSQ